MSIVAWVLLGLISGFIASEIVNRSGEGLVRNLILGVAGAVVGGWLFHMLGGMGVTGFNLGSVFVSIVGAVLLLLAYHAFFGRRLQR